MAAKGGVNIPFEVIGGPSLSFLEPRMAKLESEGWVPCRIHSGSDISLLTKTAIGLSCDGWSDKARDLAEEGAKVIVVFKERNNEDRLELQRQLMVSQRIEETAHWFF